MNASFVISARLGSGVDSARIGFATDDWVTPDLFDGGSSDIGFDSAESGIESRNLRWLAKCSWKVDKSRC